MDFTVNGSVSNATIVVGATATFVARVHAVSGYPVPDGSVTISDSTNGANIYGSANISKDPNSNDGLATITTTNIAAGTYSLVATYGGDNQGKYYNGARSNTVLLTVKAGLGGAPSGPAIGAETAARHAAVRFAPATNDGTVWASGITPNRIALNILAGTEDAALLSPVVLRNLEHGRKG